MKDRDVERIARMPRKEINSEILHLWTEQDQICKENADLKAKLERAIEQRNFWIQEAQTSGLLCGRVNSEIRESDLEIRGTSAK